MSSRHGAELPHLTEVQVQDLDFLKKTRRVIQERGWVRGDFIGGGGVCLVGAAFLATGLHEDLLVDPVRDRLSKEAMTAGDRLARLIGCVDHEELIDWNDHTVSVNEVYKSLNHCIASIR